MYRLDQTLALVLVCFHMNHLRVWKGANKCDFLDFKREIVFRVYRFIFTFNRSDS